MQRTKRGMIDTETVVTVIAITSIILIVGSLVVGVIWACVENEKNRITEGVIVDKSYTAAYTTTSYSRVGKVMVPISHYHPPIYRFQLRGEKDERTVTYWLEVSKEDYDEYKIGSYYRL